MIKSIIIAILCCLWVEESSASLSLRPPTDTVRTSRDTLPKQVIVFLPDSLIRDSLKYQYKKIRETAYKRAFTKELYKLIFVDPKPYRVNVMRTQNAEERYREYAGKLINDIRIKILPPYGVSVYDTTESEQDLGWLKTAANNVHMKSSEGILLKQLTIKKGMPLLPFELVQNEIILRQLPYVYDATIIVSPDEVHPDEVDLLIICKDDFSWGMEISSNFLNSGRITLENKNFMHLGHLAEYEISYRGTKDQKWGNAVHYHINSAFGTHFDFDGYYRNDYQSKQVGGEIDRIFLTSLMKWAGGVGYGRVYRSDNLPGFNIYHPLFPFNYYTFDTWLGHSFLLDSKYSYNRNFYLTGRFYNIHFKERPVVTADTNHSYYDRRTYLMAMTFRKLKYYKANLIYDFGRTEDVPAGFYSALTLGLETNEFSNSGYVGYDCQYSHFDPEKERYYAVDAGVASYYNKSGFQRTLFSVGLHHISNLVSLGTYRFRFYNDVNYRKGVRRYPMDYLYMQDYDILGFDSDTLRGDQKLSTSLSATLFFPYIKKGFRMSMTTFVDLGAIAADNRSILKSKTYWGMGVALTLRNDNLVFKNISFRLSYYPKVPGDIRNISASMSGNMQNGFYDYRVNKPHTLPYE